MRAFVFFAATLFSVFCTAHVRQRFFYQFDESDVSKGGMESLVHWNRAFAIKMHQFAGCLGSGSTLSFDGLEPGCAGNAQQSMGVSLNEWLGVHSLFGVAPNLSVALEPDSDPVPTSSACETTEAGGADGTNNVVFSSKLDPDCASSIEDYDGVIGLTRIRYELLTGNIAEADVQFNDVDYRFVTTTSDFGVNPPQINLEDVAVHEFGHLFGLDHSSQRTSTMLFSVSDGMKTASADDFAGLWSLYQNQSSEIGSLKGSVTLGGAPVFGVVVTVLNARTLDVVASEMTNLDGVFEFCGLPEGNYIAYANAYRPDSTNISEYYSGFLGFAPEDNGLCANPGCQRMNSSLAYSWFLEGEDPPVGKAFKVFSVSGGQQNKFINIEASTEELDLTADWSTLQPLALDTPMLLKFRSTDLSRTNPLVSGPDNVLQVEVPASGRLSVSFAALSIYSRLVVSPELTDMSDQAIAGPDCVVSSGAVTEGLDKILECENLTPGDYKIVVDAVALPCADIPGNASNCSVLSDEYASTSKPYYLINAYDPGASQPVVSQLVYSSSSLGRSKYSDLPSCSTYSTEVDEETEEPACCGSLGGGRYDADMSLLLSMLLSPLTWAMLLIGFVRFRRRLKKAHNFNQGLS